MKKITLIIILTLFSSVSSFAKKKQKPDDLLKLSPNLISMAQKGVINSSVLNSFLKWKEAECRKNANGLVNASFWQRLSKDQKLRKEFLTLPGIMPKEVFEVFGKLEKQDPKTVSRYFRFALSVSICHGYSSTFYTIWGAKKPDPQVVFSWFTKNSSKMSISLTNGALELLIKIADVPMTNTREADWALNGYATAERKLTGTYGHPPYVKWKGVERKDSNNPRLLKYKQARAKVVENGWEKCTLPLQLLDGGVCFHKSFFASKLLKYNGWASTWQPQTNHAFPASIYYDKSQKKYLVNIQHNYGRMGGRNYYSKKPFNMSTTDVIQLCKALNSNYDSFLNATLIGELVKNIPPECKKKCAKWLDVGYKQSPYSHYLWQAVISVLEKPDSAISWKYAFSNGNKIVSHLEKQHYYKEEMHAALISGITSQTLSDKECIYILKIWKSQIKSPADSGLYNAAKILVLSRKDKNVATQYAVKMIGKPTSESSLAVPPVRALKDVCKTNEAIIAIFSKLYQSLPVYCPKAPEEKIFRMNAIYREVYKHYHQALVKSGNKQLAGKVEQKFKSLSAKIKGKTLPAGVDGEVDDPAYQQWLRQLRERN